MVGRLSRSSPCQRQRAYWADRPQLNWGVIRQPRSGGRRALTLTRTCAGTFRIVAGALALAGALACHSDAIVALDPGERNRRISAQVGERIEVTLQSIGGGEYAASLSSGAVVFLDVEYCGALPAGVTQCFLFRAVSRGEAIITFTHSGMNATVQDTVDVH